MTDLGTLGGATSYAMDINDSGDIVGAASTGKGTRAFLWHKGKMTNLGTVCYTWFSEASAINETGHIVGWAQGDTDYCGFHWHDGAIERVRYSWFAGDINNKNQIVGNNNSVVASLWYEDTQAELGTLSGSWNASSSALGINDLEQVTGYSDVAGGGNHAFLWDNGTMTDLGTLGGSSSTANRINQAGQIVGSSSTADGSIHAFLWEKDDMIDLGTLGGTTSEAYGINDAGLVVGSSKTADGQTHAFLWRDGTMCDLGEGSARAINNHEQVVGSSNVDSLGYPGNSCFLPPTPSPTPTPTPTPTPFPASTPASACPTILNFSDWRLVKPTSECAKKSCNRAFIRNRIILKARATIAIKAKAAAEIAQNRADSAGPSKNDALQARAARKAEKAVNAHARFDDIVIRICNLHD